MRAKEFLTENEKAKNLKMFHYYFETNAKDYYDDNGEIETHAVHRYDDGTVGVNGNVTSKHESRFDQFPVHFSYVNGDFHCVSCGLKTAVGLPAEIMRDCNLSSNNIKNFDGISSEIGYDLSLLHNPDFDPFSISDKVIVGGEIFFDWSPNLSILRLITIPRRFRIMGNEKAWRVYIDHAGATSRTDIIRCQSDLIDAGLNSNAVWKK